jgi:hypothetical protein
MSNKFEGLYELGEQAKHGGFDDFETGLSINRDDQVEVTEPIGTKTMKAIQSGWIVLVREPREKPDEGARDKGKGKGKGKEETE